jgi:hypothetical protein
MTIEIQDREIPWIVMSGVLVDVMELYRLPRVAADAARAIRQEQHPRSNLDRHADSRLFCAI